MLSELLAAAAERSPDVVAVRSGAKELTYSELLDAVQRRAGQLAALGIGPGHRVAISMHKSVHSWISVHSVLWAGAAYVPIDPLSNGASRDSLLTDAAVSATLADSATAKSLAAADSTGQIIVVDSDASPELEPMPIGRVDVGPEFVAYVMYTSGSTGQPKGIVHTHSSAMAYAVRAAECYGLKADDRMANIAPLHFDQSTFELFSSLVAAATVIVVPAPHIRMPASLVALVAGEKVTIWYSVPTILSQMVQRGGVENHDLRALRWVLFGGEVFPSATLARLMAALPGARFSNVYGPAEVNQCTFHHLTVAPRPDETIPIGRAWANTEIRVVGADRHSPVADGESGELIVATDTMMSEYWKRPDLTTEAIFIDQDQSGPRRRWYRTGDMVRTNADGLLEFLGRRDRQVKVRGNRIELEAVESAIRDIKGVQGAAVVVIEGANQEIRLVAAVVSDSLNPAELNKAIAKRLPPHTKPDEVVMQTELPMTPTGKVDTIALARQISETAR